MSATRELAAGARVERLGAWIESIGVQRVIAFVILLNALVLGLETSPSVMAVLGPLVVAIDYACLAVFVVEIGIKLVAFRHRFFLGAWNVFDFVVVAVSLIPFAHSFSVLRALRVLRVLRLVSVVPSLRVVVQALLTAIPGMASVGALLLLVFYVFAVMATKLFGAVFPEWFGTLGASFYSLFQIMTLESWSMGIVRPVMEAFPYAWAFFVPFILMTSFAVLNLFIAIIVNAMTHETTVEPATTPSPHQDATLVLAELRALRSEVGALRRQLDGGHAAGQAQA